jgi:lactate dehydrogenase-like 2-hydroxyacid dehydrogenase
MKPKVLVTRPIAAQVLSRIASECDMQCNDQDRPLTAAELADRLHDCEGVICHLTDRMTAALMDGAPALKVISNVAVGYDNIDVPAATERGVMVTNTPGVLTDTTADFAFALLLATARRVVEGDRFVRSGEWKEWRFDLLLGSDVHHATLGIIGLGRIGQAVARRARGFAMRVLYWAPRRAASQIERELGATYVEKDALLAESDFISVNAPLRPETRHLLGRAEFEKMKRTAIVINTARGPVIDERDLVEALQRNQIAGAGLDVFEEEPTVPSELAQMPNVVLAPHIGSASRQTRIRMAEMAAENLLAAVCGRTPPNIVNPQVLASHKSTSTAEAG